MLNITIIELLVLVVLLPIVGGILGYVIASDRLRRGGDGKTPGELKQELAAYQSNVTGHFQQTAELMQQMTAQYRAIYTHMAHGAAELCSSDDGNAKLKELERLSLALDDAAAVAAVVEQREVETSADVATIGLIEEAEEALGADKPQV